MKIVIDRFLNRNSYKQTTPFRKNLVNILPSEISTLSKSAVILFGISLILLVSGVGKVYAQGYVSDVVVTTSTASIRIPVGSSTSYGAAVTTGTPQPDKEWQVVPGTLKYAWSVSLGTPTPYNTPETTINTIKFNTAQDFSSTAECVVSYQVVKNDPGQTDDGDVATISGHDPNPKSVIIHVGDFTLSVAPSAISMDSGALMGTTLYISYINGGPGDITLSQSISGAPHTNIDNIGVSLGISSGGPNEFFKPRACHGQFC